MSKIGDRFKNSWNVLFRKTSSEIHEPFYNGFSMISSGKPGRVSLSSSSFRSIINSIYNMIAVDVSAININHVRLDEENKFKEIIDSPLNYALTKSANIDQTGRELIRDIVYSLLDEGTIAVVPVLTDTDPEKVDGYKIYELRVGKIVEWYPRYVMIDLYNDLIGREQRIKMNKSDVAIVSNPFYSVMNEADSLAKRLVSVLNEIDRNNNPNSSGKFDILIQFPYSTRTEGKKALAKKRQEEIVQQLDDSPFGIGFIDSTERVIQLNRAVTNNLWEQSKDLTNQLFNQLGISRAIIEGTASDQEQMNYYGRTIEPILSAITEEMERKWLSQTAVAQKQAIKFFKDPFKLTPVSRIAEMADTFTRNEVLTSNEFRSIIGIKPVDDPKANQLRNANLNHPEEGQTDGSFPKEVNIEEIIDDTKIQND